MADYLEAYAAHFELPVRSGVRVDGLVDGRAAASCVAAGRRGASRPTRSSSRWPTTRRRGSRPSPASSARTSCSCTRASTATRRSCARRRARRRRRQLRRGHRARRRPAAIATWLSGRDAGHVPFRHRRAWPARLVLARLVLRVVFHHVLTVGTPIGRKARPKVLARRRAAHPRQAEAPRRGGRRARRAVGGRARRAARCSRTAACSTSRTSIWCTGFHAGLRVDRPAGLRRRDGEPEHERGVVDAAAGPVLRRPALPLRVLSTMVHGVGRDAERIAEAVGAPSRPVFEH